MAQLDTSMAVADSITEQYAGVMDDLIKDCTRLEDKNVELQRQLAVALQVRDAAIADRDTARRERDEARKSVRELAGFVREHRVTLANELAGHVRTVIARPDVNDDNGDCDSDDTVVVDPE